MTGNAEHSEARAAIPWARWAVALLIAVHLADALWLIRADHTPPHLSMLDHYIRAYELFGDERVGLIPMLMDPPQLVDRVLVTSDYRPPLLFIQAAVAFAVFGPSYDVAMASNLVWLAVLLWLVYRLGERWGGPTTGLLASLFLSSFPIVLGHRPLFLPFIGLGACAAGVAWSLVRYFDDGRERGPLIWLGVYTGAGLLIRWDFAPYLLGLIVWALVWGTTREHRWRDFCRFWGAAAVTLLIAGWWYASNFFQITIPFYLHHGVLQASHQRDGVHIASLWNVCYYPWTVWKFSLGPQWALPSAAALVWLVRDARPARGPLLGWLLGPWIFFLVVPMKSARYLLPALPVLALALALAVTELSRRIPRLAWIAGVLAVAHALVLTRVPGAAAVWPGLDRPPRTHGMDFTRWEDSLEWGLLRPNTDTRWADALRRIEDALRERLPAPPLEPDDPEAGWDDRPQARLVILSVEGAYVAPLQAIPRLQVFGFTFHPRLAIEGDPPWRDAIQGDEHLLVTRPLPPARRRPTAPWDDATLALLPGPSEAAADELARRPQILAVPLPDGVQEAVLYGPRRP